MVKQVLLLGAAEDPHVYRIAQAIGAQGGRGFIVDARRPKSSIALHFSDSHNCRALLTTADHETIDLRSFHAVWNRLKPLIPGPSIGPLEASFQAFAQAEWRTVFHSLEPLLGGAHWVNSAAAQHRASSKVVQLSAARRLGFEIPETCITNDPVHVIGLFDRHRRVVYKALNGHVFTDQTSILTTEVSRQTIVDSPNAVRRAPGIFQQLIEKEYELRITVVGSAVFPALIRTPKYGDAAIDWRHAHFEDIFESCTLDPYIQSLILRFQEEFKLQFGAYDLMVAKNGGIYFLECNPAGQFLWLEDLLKLPISRALACELSKTQPSFSD
jgi:hypothetical protein